MGQAAMQHYFKDRNILLGVTGSIAAYKALELTSQLNQWGARVRVVMTTHAKEFVGPVSFATLSGEPVLDDLFDDPLAHIRWAKWADLILIAPATANCIARYAMGLAEDVLGAILLATSAPVVLAPAMNQAMWAHPAIQDQVALLQKRGVGFIGPAPGLQACGDRGLGRMTEVPEILAHLPVYWTKPLLEGQTVLITAGPTQEAWDPVRYLSNRSSGKMGYALAASAYYHGAKVILISGPSALSIPPYGQTIRVKTAAEMQEAVMQHLDQASLLIACAAVCDFKPQAYQSEKIKKQGRHPSLELERTPDILAETAGLYPGLVRVGFAAETEHLIEHAKQKLQDKQLDYIIANPVSETLGFDQAEQEAILIDRQGRMIPFEKTSKAQLADRIIATLVAEDRLTHKPSTSPLCYNNAQSLLS